VPGPPTIETQQLILRRPLANDVDALFEIQRDPEAMRHTYVAPNREATVEHLKGYGARFAEDGFMPWTAVYKENEQVVGWGGLNRDPKEPHWGIEVAYFIHSGYWGRGLASEIVRASPELAFEELGIPEVIAFTRRENIGSQRVLEKAGFKYIDFVPEMERLRYKILSDR
jgi:RimJ/RimL family protein N-acetyltransferase